MTMADVFDFNEGDEDCWSFDLPTDGKKSPFSLRPASPKPENGSASSQPQPPAPAIDTTTTTTTITTKNSSATNNINSNSNINNSSNEAPAQGRATNPLFAGGRTRHARNRKRQAEELERKKKLADATSKQELLEGKENDDTPPEVTSKSRKTSTKQKNQRKKKKGDSAAGGEDDDDDDDAASTSSRPKSQSGGEGNSSFPLRRKRRRKAAPSRTTTKSTTARPPIIARRAATTGGSGITDSLSPFGDDGVGSKNSSSLSAPSAASLSLQLKQKLEKHQRNQNKLCPPDGRENAGGGGLVVVSRKIGGAGRNVFAVQDAGNHQMIHDGCFELTTTILSCPKGKILARGVIMETLSELAVMISSTKTRRILWQAEADDNDNSNRNNHSNSKALASVLDVLHHVTTALSERNSQQTDERCLPLLQKLQRIDPDYSSITNNNNTVSLPKVQQQPQQRQEPNIVENYYTGLVLDSLIALVTFLSWDVTIEHKDSVYHKNPKGARALRKEILEHEGTLRSIVYLIRHADPMVSNILEAKAATLSSFSKTKATAALGKEEEEESETTPHARNSTKVKEHQNNNNGGTSKNGLRDMLFSQSSDMDLSSTSGDINKDTAGGGHPPANSQESVASASSHNTQDPTVAGRRKRRRKKGGGGGGTALEPIAEDALSFNGSINESRGRRGMSPPRSPPRVVFEQKEECTNNDPSSLSPPKSSPPRLRLGRHAAGNNKDEGGDDGSSMVSCDNAMLRVHEHLGKAHSRFIVGANRQERTKHHHHHHRHECQSYRELHLSFGGKDAAGHASKIALNSLTRLLAGRDECDAHSCLDEVDEEPSEASERQQADMVMALSSDEEDEYTHRKPENDDGLQGNLLLQTNMMIGNSGMIPSLAQSLAETLSALMEEMMSPRPCPGCIVHLHDKFVQAAPIVDNACLMHSTNRSDFCTVTISSNEENDEIDALSNDSILVGTLTLFLQQWLREKALVNGNKTKQSLLTMLNEVALGALRTLTSLTHENDLSAEQFAMSYRDESTTHGTARSIASPKSLPSWNAVEVVSQVLHRAATCNTMESSKIGYDIRIFCLNTLANVVGEESDGEIRRILSAFRLPTNQLTSATADSAKKESLFFLSWLTHWVVSQTDSFRDAILKGSFGKNSKSGENDANQHHSNRQLTKHEEEQLVTAGNGCVLLACLLQEPSSSEESLAKVVATIRETILSEMPLDDKTGLPSGTTFLKNTLRAFCNFIYHSMGDLSVAVVAPVKVLIKKLEAFSISYSRGTLANY